MILRWRVLLLAAALWGQEAVPEELLDNLDFFMTVDVDEAAANDDFFDAMISSKTPGGLDSDLSEGLGAIAKDKMPERPKLKQRPKKRRPPPSNKRNP